MIALLLLASFPSLASAAPAFPIAISYDCRIKLDSGDAWQSRLNIVWENEENGHGTLSAPHDRKILPDQVTASFPIGNKRGTLSGSRFAASLLEPSFSRNFGGDYFGKLGEFGSIECDVIESGFDQFRD